MNLISLRSATSFCHLDSNSPKIIVDKIFDLFYNILHILQILYQVKIKSRWWNLPQNSVTAFISYISAGRARYEWKKISREDTEE